MSTPLVVIGAGGFGRETLDVVEAINRCADHDVFEVLGVVDSNPSRENLARLEARGIAYLGTDAEWRATGNPAKYLIGIGDPSTRRRIDSDFRNAGLAAATAIHPSASVGSSSQIGSGTVICSGVQVSTNVLIGRNVHLNPNSTVGHDAVLEDFVSVNPASTISGDVQVRSLALIGAASVILQGLVVGVASVVGAASCVVRDVAPGATVKGVPAR